MNSKNLILDLDNSLYDYDSAHKTAIEEALMSFSIEFGIEPLKVKEDYSRARKMTHNELPSQAASHNRLLYFQKLLELNDINCLPNALKYYHIYWDAFLKEMTLFSGVMEFLKKEKMKGRKICILTDLTAQIQFRKINKLGIKEYIDFLVTSEEVGIEKPHPRMFEKALKKLNCGSNEALMIGDSWKKDIEGASLLGIKNIWINLKNEEFIFRNGTTMVSKFEEIKN